MVIVDVKMVSGFIPVKASVKKVNPKFLTDSKVMANAVNFILLIQFSKRFIPSNLFL